MNVADGEGGEEEGTGEGGMGAGGIVAIVVGSVMALLFLGATYYYYKVMRPRQARRRRVHFGANIPPMVPVPSPADSSTGSAGDAELGNGISPYKIVVAVATDFPMHQFF